MASYREAPGSDLGPSTMHEELQGTRYRLLRPLATGGMGEVYEVEHLGLGARFVMKVLLGEHAGDFALVDRLRVEAQLMSRLRHPNLLWVLDLGRTRLGRPFFVSHRIEGETLRELLARGGALPPVQAVDLACQVLTGLEVVHHAGIIHRDIKPSNVFVCAPDGQGRRCVKLMDFGVAKVRELATALGTVDAPLVATAEGAAVGTPRYVAPEQAVAKPVDERTDIYAVGGLLYTMLTGKPPFCHPSAAQLILAHATEAPDPPSRSAPGTLPGRLDAAVLQALAKRPEDRFQTAGEMEQALRDAVEPTAVPAEPTAVLAEPTAVLAEPTAVLAEPTAVASAAPAPAALAVRVATALVAGASVVALGWAWGLI